MALGPFHKVVRQAAGKRLELANVNCDTCVADSLKARIMRSDEGTLFPVFSNPTTCNDNLKGLAVYSEADSALKVCNGDSFVVYGVKCLWATGSDSVKSGETFYAGKKCLATLGTMPNRGSVTLTPSTTDQTIAKGYHDGTGKCSGDADIGAGAIQAGVNLWGTVGTFPSDGTATTAASCRAGKTWYAADQNKITGTADSAGTVVAADVKKGKTARNSATFSTAITGTADSVGTAVAADCRKGKTFRNSSSFSTLVTGTADSTGDATAGDVANGKTFRHTSSLLSTVTGTVTDQGTKNYTPTVAGVTIAAGKHSGSGVCYGDAKAVAANIQSGYTLNSMGGSYSGTTDLNYCSSATYTSYGNCTGQGVSGSWNKTSDPSNCRWQCGMTLLATCWHMYDVNRDGVLYCICTNGSPVQNGPDDQDQSGNCTD
jgi:hypothetical protein